MNERYKDAIRRYREERGLLALYTVGAVLLTTIYLIGFFLNMNAQDASKAGQAFCVLVYFVEGLALGALYRAVYYKLGINYRKAKDAAEKLQKKDAGKNERLS